MDSEKVKVHDKEKIKKPISSYLDHPKLRLHCNILTIEDYEGIIIITCGKLKTKLIITANRSKE